MIFALSSQMITVSWSSSTVWVDASLWLVTFQTSSSLSNPETGMIVFGTWFSFQKRFLCIVICLFKPDKDLLILLLMAQVVSQPQKKWTLFPSHMRLYVIDVSSFKENTIINIANPNRLINLRVRYRCWCRFATLFQRRLKQDVTS